MKIFIVIVCSFLYLSTSLSAQKNRIVVVRAGTKVADYFSFSEKYRYPDFVPGQALFKSGRTNDLKMNYNMLFSEIEFVQGKDTLSISRKKDLKYVVATDTFYYSNGFIEIISGGQIKVGLKQYFRIRDVLKTGAYGTTVRAGSADTYNSMSVNAVTYDLVPNEDIELQKTVEYYLYTPDKGFDDFTKKNVLEIFPGKSDEIKAYIKSNKVDFNSRDDLLKFAEYLRTL